MIQFKYLPYYGINKGSNHSLLEIKFFFSKSAGLPNLLITRMPHTKFHYRILRIGNPDQHFYTSMLSKLPSFMHLYHK